MCLRVCVFYLKLIVLLLGSRVLILPCDITKTTKKMSLNFYDDQTRANYTGVGFTIKEQWYLEVWTLFPYVLVWFSMCRMLVRRDLSSIFFYIGLMIHEYIGELWRVPWEISILTHFVCFTACSLSGSVVSRTFERTLGFILTLIVELLMLVSNLITNETTHFDMLSGMLIGGVTGAVWFLTMRVLDDNVIWNTLFTRRCMWNCMVVRHTRGIMHKTLFEYFLTQELNVRRHNIVNTKTMRRESISGLTTETPL